MITNTDIPTITTGDAGPVTTYKAARAVAGLVASHFERHHIAVTKYYEQELAPRPDARTIESVIDTTFWASLRREESRWNPS